MKNVIDVTFTFSRCVLEDGYKRDVETFTNTFEHNDEDTYGNLLEKFQLMLQAIGYELGDNRVMIVDPSEVITDITNVVEFFPKDDE